MIRIEAASLTPPRGLSDLLADLGDGENGFTGTPVHTGEATLEEYLRRCCDMPDPAKLKPGLVPQTVFWALDSTGEAVGIVRLRHHLIDKLRVHISGDTIHNKSLARCLKHVWNAEVVLGIACRASCCVAWLEALV